MSNMARGIPGMGETTVTYTGPADLRLALPARSDEQARAKARDLLSRSAEAVARAEGEVSRLAPGYPRSFDATLAFLRGRNLAALDAAQGADAFGSLGLVERAAADVESTARSLLEAARGISQRIRRTK